MSECCKESVAIIHDAEYYGNLARYHIVLGGFEGTWTSGQMDPPNTIGHSVASRKKGREQGLGHAFQDCSTVHVPHVVTTGGKTSVGTSVTLTIVSVLAFSPPFFPVEYNKTSSYITRLVCIATACRY